MISYDGLLDPNVPMHYQIYIQLRNEIVDGLWAGRTDFPGEEQLAAKFNVSIITSRKALARLGDEGLIRRERGRRPTIIYDLATAQAQVPAPTIYPMGPCPFSYKVLSMGIQTVPAEACAAFGLPPGSQLWACTRLRKFWGRCHSVSQSVQRATLGAQHSRKLLTKLPMIDLLQRAGKQLARLHRKVNVAHPSADAARYLNISLNRPTLVYTYGLTDDRDEFIDWVRIYVHPDEPSASETMNLIDHSWEMLDVV